MRKLTYLDAEWIRLFRTHTRASVRMLAKEFKVCPTTIENIIYNRTYLGQTAPPPPPRPGRSLTADEVREMRRLYAKGVGPWSIARRMNKPTTTVRQVVSRITYKEIA